MNQQNVKQIVAATVLAAGSFGAHAALTTLSGAEWPPVPSSGLQNVQFNLVDANGIRVATGAHAYKEGATLPNNGFDTFYANAGYSPNAPTSNARWAVDYMVNYGAGTLANYVTTFSFDIDPTAGENYNSITLDASNCGALGICGLNILSDSQNAVYVYSQLFALGSGFAFDPTAASGSYGFKVSVQAVAGAVLSGSGITVDIPEPASLALAGLALAAAGIARRRRPL